MNVIEANKISKNFPGVHALKDVDFSVKGGEVHGLVGENGAGKSTLIKILGGVYSNDGGEIFLNEKEIIFHNPLDARKNGITVIFQELSLVPYLTVAENIFLGLLPQKRGILDGKRLFQEADKILEELKCPFYSNEFVGKLSTGKKQMVEIARALAYDTKVIIFDEPTASLGEEEIKVLFTQIAKLKEKGSSVIYISHKLEEIFMITDQITVMRDGKKIATMETKDSTNDEIVEMMIGRNIESYYIKIEKEIKEEILRIENFGSHGVFENINFSINKGEILGFYGLVGAGRSELMRSIFGIDKRDTGKIYLNGKQIDIHHPIDAVKSGIALVPEERKEEGLVLLMDVLKNMNLVKVRENSTGPFLNKKRQQKVYKEFKEKLQIKTPSESVLVENLSGGNQQKVVLAKWLSMNPKILILDEPTRGIDVGSKSEIHKLIVEMAKNGIAVIVISSEMPEIIGLSDRIIAMCGGRITGVFKNDEFSEKSLMYSITDFAGTMDIKTIQVKK